MKHKECGGEVEYYEYSCDDPECGCGYFEYYWWCRKCEIMLDFEDIECDEEE